MKSIEVTSIEVTSIEVTSIEVTSRWSVIRNNVTSPSDITVKWSDRQFPKQRVDGRSP